MAIFLVIPRTYHALYRVATDDLRGSGRGRLVPEAGRRRRRARARWRTQEARSIQRSVLDRRDRISISIPSHSGAARIWEGPPARSPQGEHGRGVGIQSSLTVHDHDRRRAAPGHPAYAVPAFGQLGLRPVEQFFAVERREVDAAAAFGIAPVVVPVGGV